MESTRAYFNFQLLIPSSVSHVNMNCSYNCSKLPEELQSNGDIAGLGVSRLYAHRVSVINSGLQVVLGFTLTALLSILMVISYYLFVFDPSWGLIPHEESPSSPNPVDVCVLRFRRWLPEYLDLRRFAGSNAERAFYKVTGCLGVST